MEIGIGKHEGAQEVLPLEHPLASPHASWDGQSDLAVFGPIKFRRCDALHEVDASCDPFRNWLSSVSLSSITGASRPERRATPRREMSVLICT